VDFQAELELIRKIRKTAFEAKKDE
jgi:alpha-D-ribose 1-methylphosphonate 5-triphosphate synthase subunit PhnI